MLAVISALAATTYLFSVASSVLFTATAFDKDFTRKLFGGASLARRFLGLVEVLSSAISEQPLHLFALKLAAFVVATVFGAFNYTLACLFKWIDICNCAALLILFAESLREKEVFRETIKDMTGGEPSELAEDALSLDWRRILLPVSTPDNIVLYPNIPYATNEESTLAVETTKDYDQPRRMMLDVYACSKSPKDAARRPVLVHIHGGAWKMGSKNMLYPHEKTLITENNWIVVNIGYRLAPKNAYPTHLCDVKRALRWIKASIPAFGGDPNFIVLSGDSAGGHLASMAAFTANEPEYQPGFELVDTAVQGVITFNGVLDVQNDHGRAVFFSRDIALQPKVDTAFLSKHSPIDIIKKAKEENHLVPFLILTGERDALVDCGDAMRFKETYDHVLGEKTTQCTLVKLPGAHHICHASWSPRGLYISRLCQVWCQQLYQKKK